MTTDTPDSVFSAETPPDPGRASAIREEAIDWLESRFSLGHTFAPSEVLALGGERERRWLLPRLRSHGLVARDELGIAEVADALTVLNLRARGVKFRDAIDAVTSEPGVGAVAPRYGGVWNRLIAVAEESVRRTLPSRLLTASLAALVEAPADRANALVIIRSALRGDEPRSSSEPAAIDHDEVYRALIRHPATAFAVSTPGGELLLLEAGQSPSRSELTSRSFVRIAISTDRAEHDVTIGGLHPFALTAGAEEFRFVGRLLDLVAFDLDRFAGRAAQLRIDAATEPTDPAEDDLRLWVLAQVISAAYPGSLCEVVAASADDSPPRVLASSASQPWEPTAIGTPRTLEMLSDYAGRVGIPLVVEQVVEPYIGLINSAGGELRYLESLRDGPRSGGEQLTAAALPIVASSGEALGALYLIAPNLGERRLGTEVRVLTAFARVLGELMERQRATRFAGELIANGARTRVLEEGHFHAELLALLRGVAQAAGERLGRLNGDIRLPFLLLSAYRPDAEEPDANRAGELADWLERTMRHLDWRSFVRGRLAETSVDLPASGFMGELPGIGMLIALDQVVSKDELDQIRNVFPSAINALAPANSPVRLLAWVLDVPAARIAEADAEGSLEQLTEAIERWASDVASVLHDVVESSTLAHDLGDWEGALRRVRRALQREGGRTNTYLHRIGAECAFSLGDWPSAREFAERAVELSAQDPGSGGTRSRCQAGDASLLLLDPTEAWRHYDEAVARAPSHPLPRYYRANGALLLARLLHEYLRSADLDEARRARVMEAVDVLSGRAMADAEAAAALLEGWGLIPESYQYRNFHLVPTLLAQGTAYQLREAPGPAASRLQSARRSFPKDDVFFREFLFAKCCEQQLHVEYGELVAAGAWSPQTSLGGGAAPS